MTQPISHQYCEDDKMKMMGSGPSSHQSQDLMDHHHQYPDMNVIFRGIPKMIQVCYVLRHMGQSKQSPIFDP
ncbi:unnamed protein product [Nippostrongylus brasiliensis]|uniref:Ovule protein n=1 Tax=Nippostrongylus brasiliensis TaxID=27835 RepID=A0A0N4Y027_NIPBR|nr:unnamed protein product [Nippostrongylus brasiliensis]